jgi:hypothetical protein
VTPRAKIAGMDARGLRDAELDAWVALAQGHRDVRLSDVGGRRECHSLAPGAAQAGRYAPSTDWDAADRIIAAAHIVLREMVGTHGEPKFEAMLRHDDITWFAEGELPLIAAMRVYVRSRFGDEQLRSPPF